MKADWLSGRAYMDNAGNFRLKRPGQSRGPIAPWNIAAKRTFPSVAHFHDEIHNEDLYPKLTQEQRSALETAMRKEFGFSYARRRFWEAQQWLARNLRQLVPYEEQS